MRRFLLQAVQEEDHLAPAREVFGLADLDRAIISTAFMTASGLLLLKEVLEPIANRTKLFVGIRNGVTTVQSIQKALEIGCETYLVDTGTRTRIFHPKLYYAHSTARAKLLLGSANLTMGGLRTNIEASVLQTFDPAIADDAGFLVDLETKLNAMITDFPEHVIRATDHDQLAVLLRSGRLLDERKVRAPEPAGSSADRDLDTVPRMKLLTAPISVPRAALPPVPTAAPTAPVALARQELVWESDGLTERHLNIPTGSNTNATGSMLFGLGAWSGIDHQFYFRDEVFKALNWTNDTALEKSHLERAWATFRLIIKDLDYGEKPLKLTHNSLTSARIIKARNSKTQLHWGLVKPLVARKDLLGSVLKLFRDTDDPTRFTLEID